MMKKKVLSAVAAVMISDVVCAETMRIYADPKSGQLFMAPGEGRIDMGDFISAQEVDRADREQASLVAEYKDKVDTYVAKSSKNWSNKLKIGGYMQFRNTEWLDGEGQDINPSTAGIQPFGGYWADKSTNNDSNFFIRRARLILSGNVGDHLGIYIQPDFASQPSSSTSGNFGQLRDFYGDVYIDKDKEHRVRIGQSKVPFGFENMQSSSKRLTLDRNDAFNSAVKDERDIGAFYYYTPVAVQNLFEEIDNLGLKSTGNYGMFALGAYNGQGANNLESNGNNHIVARLTYPFKTESGQIFEFGIQGYKGDYVLPNTSGTLIYPDGGTQTANTTFTTKGIDDERIGISAIMYQQPFGIQAEWLWGKTPGADSAASTNIRLSEHSLQGGYVQTMYRLTNVLKDGDVLTPFVKWQYFDGFSKAEKNAPYNQVNDWEIGAEWQMAKEFELTTVIHKMDRTDLSQLNGYGNRFEGTAFRVQAQINY